MNRDSELYRALNKLAKWRSLFAGWQLGTRMKGDPESDAVRDAAEARLLMRAEISAILGLCLKKGVFTQEEIDAQLLEEAQHLDKQMEKFFPGWRSADDGLVCFDPQAAAQSQKGWKK